VDFRESVRVIWPGEVSGVVARAVNLSPAGILVDAPTPTPCPVGSDVLCDVTLPRGPRLLRGRVAHRRMLASQKVGMGIEFVDLSPREVAELRDIVGESEERPQRVKVRFEGTNQIVRARAHATPEGFRLATALPFLKADTEVDIALSPDERVNARGWVSGVALDESHADGVPRLLIDVQVDGRRGHALGQDDKTPVVDHKTPVVQPLSPHLTMPGYVFEPEELGALRESATIASLDAPIHVAAPAPDPAFAYATDFAPGFVPSVSSLGAPLPEIADGPASGPSNLNEGDLTEVIPIAPVERRGWSSFGVGMLVGVGLLALLAVFILVRPGAKHAVAPASISPPSVVTAPVAAPAPAPEVVAPEPVAAAPTEFVVGLKGSVAGARRYLLANPDGVAFNLPRARATMKLGTYPSPAPGLRNVWVRALPGGGTHLRFHFESDQPAPTVELAEDGVHVSSR
jgi:hypothetical protein